MIGRIVKSQSHIDYLCRIADAFEVVEIPASSDYGFGRFVEADGAVGIIYNSQLLNPDYGQMGPRLTTPPEANRVFSPDYLNEQAILVNILLVGEWRDRAGWHGVPPLVLPVNAAVRALSSEEIVAFHRNPSGKLHMGYYAQILSLPGMGRHLVTSVLQTLSAIARPEEQPLLQVLQHNLNWQMTVAGS